jgi:4-amino-4-deoxychorismate lyase
MCLLLETIKIMDGKIQNLPYHISRMNETVKALFHSCEDFSNLVIDIPQNCRQGLYKCRIIYSTSIKEIEFLPYTKRAINKIIIIEDNEISYPFKFADRSCFTKYTDTLNAGEEIIIVKNNLITDSSFSNIALWNGRYWVTPEKPLLHGTKRQQLLDENFIIEKPVSLTDFYTYQKISLINAMNDLGEIEIQLKK